MFILTGTDVVLRDLNSSNGTVVNGESISEVILRPGDIIQIGVVQIKFEPGVRRPKLSQTAPQPVAVKPARQVEEFLLRKISGRLPSAVQTTVKLPTARPAQPVADDSAFVKGEAPISYENLPKPEVPGRRRPVMLMVTGLILVLVIIGAGVGYWFLVLKR
jgi:pSer/pThr/pTyr-binding forkhead associated (FHA) protein